MSQGQGASMSITIKNARPALLEEGIGGTELKNVDLEDVSACKSTEASAVCCLRLEFQSTLLTLAPTTQQPSGKSTDLSIQPDRGISTWKSSLSMPRRRKNLLRWAKSATTRHDCHVVDAELSQRLSSSISFRDQHLQLLRR